MAPCNDITVAFKGIHIARYASLGLRIYVLEQELVYIDCSGLLLQVLSFETCLLQYVFDFLWHKAKVEDLVDRVPAKILHSHEGLWPREPVGCDTELFGLFLADLLWGSHV
jgi:hypothetical protein